MVVSDSPFITALPWGAVVVAEEERRVLGVVLFPPLRPGTSCRAESESGWPSLDSRGGVDVDVVVVPARRRGGGGGEGGRKDREKAVESVPSSRSS